MIRLTLLAASAALCACAAPVSSSRLAIGADAYGEGLSYYLPKRDVRLVVTREATSEGVEKAEAAFAKARALQFAAEEDLKVKKDASAKAQRAVAAATAMQADEAALKPLLAAARTARIDEGEAQFTADRLKREADARADAYRGQIEAVRSGSVASALRETARIEVLPPGPDPSQRFVAKLNHSVLRDDSWDIKTTPEGLLTSSQVDPDGQLDEIVTEVGKFAVAQFVGPGVKLGDLTMAWGENKTAQTTFATGCPASFTFERVFDPAEFSAIKENLDAELSKLCSSFRLDVEAPAEAGAPANPDVLSRGFAYRRPLPYRLVLRKATVAPTALANLRQADFSRFRTEVVHLPNGAPVDVVPFDASAAAARTMSATFENGMLVALDFDKPSEGKAVAAIPLNIVKGASSELGNLLTLRTQATTKRVNDAAEETRLLEEFKKTLKARQDYDAALKAYLEGAEIADEDEDESE